MSGAPVSVLLLCRSLALTGGVERFVCQLGSDLATRGLDVSIGSADPAGARLAYPVAAGVRIVSGGKRRSERSVAGRDEGAGIARSARLLGEQWRIGGALGRLAAAAGPDVVVLNDLATSCATLLLNPSLASRAICCDHNHFGARSRFWRWLRARLYSRVAAVVSLTEADRPRFAALNGNTRVIANASSLAAAAPALPAAPTVLAVGRQQAQKGFDLLLQAWAATAAAMPEARLRIVGDGPLHDELARLAASLGVAGSVEWRQPTDDIEALYREAAVFVLSSRYEGMPLALLEAQALGVPAVAFDCPTGPAEIVGSGDDGETGILVPAGDVAALAAAMLALLRDPARRARMGSAAIARSRSLFGRQRQADAWALLIGEVAAARTQRRPAP